MHSRWICLDADRLGLGRVGITPVPGQQHKVPASLAGLTRDPSHIREFYSVKSHRIEPVGLVYLMPTNTP
jgi:hypothetical protein